MIKLPQLPLEQQIDNFTTDLAKHTLKIISGNVANLKGTRGHSEAAVMLFLSKMMASMLYKSLADVEPKESERQEELYERAMKNYAIRKAAVQNAVGNAFSSAMSNYVNKDVEYYCQVKLMPECDFKYPV